MRRVTSQAIAWSSGSVDMNFLKVRGLAMAYACDFETWLPDKAGLPSHVLHRGHEPYLTPRELLPLPVRLADHRQARKAGCSPDHHPEVLQGRNRLTVLLAERLYSFSSSGRAPDYRRPGPATVRAVPVLLFVRRSLAHDGPYAPKRARLPLVVHRLVEV